MKGLFSAHVVFEGPSVPDIRKGAHDSRASARPTGAQPHTSAYLACKGRKQLINVMFDSGAGTTLISHGAVKAMGWTDLLVPADGSYSSASG